jgi:hypothetical protein
MTHTIPPQATNEMIEFAYRWMPFDGSADDDIFIEFGVSPGILYWRVAELLARGHGRLVPPSQVPAMMAYCRRKSRQDP